MNTTGSPEVKAGFRLDLADMGEGSIPIGIAFS
jgi:hypothetical protein